MITTKDVKLKETKDTKLTKLTTGEIKPIEFVDKGKGKPFDKRMITTSNVDQFQRDLAKERKKSLDKKRRDDRQARKLAKETKKKPTATRDSGRDE